MGMMAPAPGAMGMMPMMPMGAPPPAAAPAGPPPIPSYAPTPATPAAPRTVMPGSLAPAPAPPAAPPPAPGLLQPQSLDLFGMPVAAPPPAPVAMPPAFAAPAAAAPAADPNDWGLDGLDLSGGPAAPPAAAPAPGGRNDWPAPEGVDPNVWSQLPEDMQRELLLQRGMEEPGGGRSAPAPTAPPPPASLRPAAASHGADAYRVARAPATGSEGVVQVEVLARISQRTLATKVWKPAVAVVKGHRELLVFRSSSDWAQYRNAAVHGGGDVDIIQALKNVSSLLKKHVMLTGAHKCSPIKMKDYKAVGALHHFTLEEANNAVVAKFAAKHDAPLFELRAAIATAIRNARGGGGDYGAAPPNADAVGRYAA